VPCLLPVFVFLRRKFVIRVHVTLRTCGYSIGYMSILRIKKYSLMIRILTTSTSCRLIHERKGTRIFLGCSSLQEMLRADAPDVGCVPAPPASHEKLLCVAAEAGAQRPEYAHFEYPKGRVRCMRHSQRATFRRAAAIAARSASTGCGPCWCMRRQRSFASEEHYELLERRRSL
jgi:hypothetical protein